MFKEMDEDNSRNINLIELQNGMTRLTGKKVSNNEAKKIMLAADAVRIRAESELSSFP